MRKTYKICCGVDVHKTFLVATIVKTANNIPHYEKKRFSTFAKDLRLLKHWLLNNNCFDLCMESTGKYWIPVWNMLEDKINVTIANPKWVSAVKGNKDDTKDSKWIADLFRMGIVPGSYIPCRAIRILREFTRYRYKLVCMRSSEKNRYQNAFTVSNCNLDAIVSDMFGKSAMDIENYLLEIDMENFDPEYCKSLLRRSLKKKADSVIESVESFNMIVEQKERIKIIQEHFNDLDARINRIDEQIEKLIVTNKWQSAISLICSIPGIDRHMAITIISEIGTDMTPFSSSKRLCCWAGLTPGNNQSAGKKKSVKITRAGIYLKPALVQAAHAAVKSTTNPYFKNKYERIYKRRGKKRAIIAIARKILTAIYHMFKNGELFNPCDIYKESIPETVQLHQKKKAAKQAIKLLVNLGLIAEDTVPLELLAS